MSGELRVEGVGKAYRVWGSEWLRAASWFGLPTRPREEHWVLRDVSFSIAPGEAVGVIGQNGAGKSTLLKLITGTAQPTEGRVTRTGRVAAILELGMGFNQDLTGRQNAFHSAGLMGYSQEQIAEAMPGIEAFAEIGEYFDEPVRTYSSGMQVRVAFAVATAFTPDLLIVDEALSVGDSYFQHKSFDRMRRFREEGTSIMLVSHSPGDVKALCDRVILLDKGQVLKDGAPDEVIDFYNALIARKENEKLSVEQRRDESGWITTRSGSGQAVVSSLKLVDAATGSEVALAMVGQQLRLVLEAEVRAPLPSLVLGFMIRDKQGHVVWGSNTWHTEQVQSNVSAGERLRYTLDFTCRMGPGSYSVSPALVSSDTHMIDNFEWVDNLLVFEVMNADHPMFIGSNWLDAEFAVERSTVI
ncbi:ABC transporter ATP-binding protein [Stenotrophomonas maltophilia]|uniref:ABC transporter ATP-binding protein n=1 Tax=Stenotrophomonas TaxID=40323 RepID=UPI000D0B2F68|nr:MULTISPECIES: ABC transporter ATP-binding protein [Stenotrophomonas]AVO28914.1 sugar ABC transporter ATP-binding protein [Stenotrophomonas maltophilia]ELC7323319.1 ABC transporter ATP-binding protein [Stenotrophomonas maltophilia]MBA0276661.1 ABC transporter ATP-binding protein [Stenotrophomonas maltophilia]MBA0413591.1 ABC transporter ATP-binding protein [Stenotrophomonas maltophilia]MBA0498766.1 ABC transporter ATP-binding protein [Stenotrophomonas maltophilia]